MRRRIGCVIALGWLAGLGPWGCATSAKRGEAPLQFRDWGASSRSASASTTAGPVTGSSLWDESPKTASSPWRYRPGSLLFRRGTKDDPARRPAASSGPGGTLARFFPTLHGQAEGEAARVDRARRPVGGEGPASSPLGGESIEAARTALTGSGAGVAPVLPVGIRVEAYPGPAPAAAGLARRGETPDAPTAIGSIAAGEQLASHETSPSPSPAPEPEESSAREHDLIDEVAAGLVAGKSPAAPPRAGATAVADATGPGGGPDAMPGSLSPSLDPEAAPLERPRRGDTAELAVRPMAPPESVARRPAAGGPAEAAATSAPPASSPSPSRPPVRSEDDPLLAGRPRMGGAAPMALPPPEFPATYHTESLRQVAREATPADRSGRPATAPDPDLGDGASARRPLFPRLARLLTPAAEAPRPDSAAAKATATAKAKGPGEPPKADGSVRPTAARSIAPAGPGPAASGRAERRGVPQRWEVFQGLPTHRVDEPTKG